MINYLVGDACEPQGEGPKIIAHVCNDIGGWGRGFVLSLSRKWPQPERVYRRWYRYQENMVIDPELSAQTIGIPLKLGEVVFVYVHDAKDPTQSTHVANMIGQHGVMVQDGIPPIRYDALERCLEHVATVAQRLNASVHMPRIGCGLAGGKWTEIEPIIDRALVRKGIPTYVYDFNTGDARTVPWSP